VRRGNWIRANLEFIFVFSQLLAAEKANCTALFLNYSSNRALLCGEIRVASAYLIPWRNQNTIR